MQPRFANAIPQLMQRHTGTPWQHCEERRRTKRLKTLPVPATEPPLRDAAATALKAAVVRERQEQ